VPAVASVNLHRLASEVRAIPRSGMIAAAKASKRIVVEEGRRIAGADGIKGKKRRGLKLRARDDIATEGPVTTCRIQGSVPGWLWVTFGTAPHRIRRRKRGPMRKMTVPHPGTAGGSGWYRVIARIEDVVPHIFADEVRRVVR
jgi:hypothetical protein